MFLIYFKIKKISALFFAFLFFNAPNKSGLFFLFTYLPMNLLQLFHVFCFEIKNYLKNFTNSIKKQIL